MIEHFVDLETTDGMMNTFVVHPEEHGPHPLVLFLMDAPGMREEIRDMSRRLATAGYYVMAPHLYYRDVEHYNVFETGDRERMFELMDASLTPPIPRTCSWLWPLARSTSAQPRLTAMPRRR